MTEEEIAGSETAAEEGAALDDAEDAEGSGTIIQDTDIVFDCPHCGHNLAIDYRGAGLQITCVNCGESVLVPIPDGMEIDDLDIEPGEILKQLFATRRNLHKAELRADDLVERLAEATDRRERIEARFAAHALPGERQAHGDGRSPRDARAGRRRGRGGRRGRRGRRVG